jgi:hypothetical protein
VLEEVPRGEMGKLQREELQALFKAIIADD